MVYEFKFPDVGEGIHEGVIVSWEVKEGDSVKEDDTLGKVETDKAVVDIPSPKTGTILKIHFKEGDTIKVGETIVTIGEKGEKISKSTKTSAPKAKPKQKEKVEPAPAVKPEGKIKAIPRIRKLAKEKGIDLTTITGTGPKGAITEKDLVGGKTPAAKAEVPKSAASKFKVVKKYDIYGHIERKPLKGVRKTIAERMIKSLHTAAPVTTHDEVDVTELVKIREKEKIKLKKQGIKLTYLPFVMKACLKALIKHPYANSSIDENTQEIIYKKYYNMGFAVATEAGLLVPVVKRVDQKSIADLAKELKDLGDKAKERTINLGDMQGSTFSITNYGSIGGMFATPVINYPEAAILGTGRIYDKAVPIKGKIQIRKVLPLSLTFDHRIFDGAEAQLFFNTIMEHLKDPDLLLVDMK